MPTRKFGACILLLAFRELIQVDAQRKTNGVGQGIVGHYRNDVGRIQGHHVELDAYPCGEVLAVPFKFVLVKIAGAQGKLIGVPVFGTQGVGDLLQFFLHAAGGVAEGLKHGFGNRHVAVHHTVVVAAFIGSSSGGGHHQFVQIQGEHHAVVAVEFGVEGQAQAQVGGDELLVDLVVGNFITDVGNVDAGSQLRAFAHQFNGGAVVKSQIGRKGIARLHVLLHGIEVGANVAEGHGAGKFFGQEAAVGYVQGKFVGVYYVTPIFDGGGVGDISQSKIPQRGADRLHFVEAHEAGQVVHVDVVDQLAQPGGVGHGGTHIAVDKGKFGRIPMLRINVWSSGHPGIAHGACPGVGRYADEGNGGIDDVDLLSA